ncbi:hypothetical protein BU16DRAFT_527826 [Lophium mytilinum]|uniref:Mitochondrial carrier n=1 Tax=Lophium mytilinum TaxID=390894 RepID=A0A6A6QRU1_9PEZI|nr:hypothetical protein BU16DRAFT_527826 [Lophium mytilinum]
MPLLRLPQRFPTIAQSSLRVTPISRSFATTPFRQLKEDANRSGEEIEAKKQEQLKKQDKGEGHWHEELGSQSESHVKADQQKVDDHDEHMEDLQKETAKKGEEGKI